MAKGYDKSKERKGKVSMLGRYLTKRSKSTCELCEAQNVRLEIYEVPPVDEEPELEKSIFICESCKKIISNLKKAKENDLRFLNATIWSEVPIVKAVSIYILKKLKDDYIWANDILDNAYLDEETEDLIKNIDL